MYYILVGSERSLPLTVALALALRDGLPLALASTLSRGRRVRARSPCGRSLAVPGSAGVLAAPFCTAAVCGAINGSLGYCESPHGVVIALALALALALAPAPAPTPALGGSTCHVHPASTEVSLSLSLSLSLLLLPPASTLAHCLAAALHRVAIALARYHAIALALALTLAPLAHIRTFQVSSLAHGRCYWPQIVR